MKHESATENNRAESLGRSLVRYDAIHKEMCLAINTCHSFPEIRDLRDKAIALETYAKQAMNTEAERKATEIRLRAERRAGQLLAQTVEAGERQGRGGDRKSNSHASSLIPTLSELGISEDKSSRWQALAEVPEHQFESALRDPKTKPSTRGILRESKPEPIKAIDPDALWVWGRLRDFERDRITDRDPAELFECMTDTMRDDVLRLLPSVISWLKALNRRK